MLSTAFRLRAATLLLVLVTLFALSLDTGLTAHHLLAAESLRIVGDSPRDPSLAQAVDVALAAHTTIFTGSAVAIEQLRARDGWVLIRISARAEGEDTQTPPASTALALAHHTPAQGWQVALEGTPELALLGQGVPPQLLTTEALTILATPAGTPQQVTYKFPWAAGQAWSYSQGWHDRNSVNNAVDLATASSDKRVLLAAGGVVTNLCVGALSTNVDVRDADGVTLVYAHLEKTTLNTAVTIGSVLPQGFVLGSLRPDTWQDSCGRTIQNSASGHLHWLFPLGSSLTVDGCVITEGVNAFTCGGTPRGPGSTFTSTNQATTSAGWAFSNGSFEDGSVAPWTWQGDCNSAVYDDPAAAQHGTFYLATNRNGTTSCTSFWQDLLRAPTAGTSYRFGIWARTNATEPMRIELALWALGGMPAERTSMVVDVLPGDWQFYQVGHTPQGSDHTFLRAEVYLRYDLALGGSLLVDNAQVTSGAALLGPEVGAGTSRHQAFVDAYQRNGGAAVLGYPTTAARWMGSAGHEVVIQRLSGPDGTAAIVHHERADVPALSVPAFVVRDALLARYLALGGPDSWLGMPTSDQYRTSTGAIQASFEHGTLTRDDTTITEQRWPTEGPFTIRYTNGHNRAAGPAWVRAATSISEAWGTGAPGNGAWGVWADQFRVEVDGQVLFDPGGYRLVAAADDRIRVLIDGTEVLAATLEQRERWITLGGSHAVQAIYEEDGGSAAYAVTWERQDAAAVSRVFIPRIIR